MINIKEKNKKLTCVNKKGIEHGQAKTHEQGSWERRDRNGIKQRTRHVKTQEQKGKRNKSKDTGMVNKKNTNRTRIMRRQRTGNMNKDRHNTHHNIRTIINSDAHFGKAISPVSRAVSCESLFFNLQIGHDHLQRMSLHRTNCDLRLPVCNDSCFLASTPKSPPTHSGDGRHHYYT